MISEKPGIAAVCFTLMCLAPISCAASEITVNYSGTILISQAPGISDGSSFTGSFSYDSTLQPVSAGTYLSSGGVSFAADGFSFSTAPGVMSDLELELDNSSGHDTFGVGDQSGSGGPVTFTTNYQTLPLFQLSNNFVWPAGTLLQSESVQNGALPDPFDVNFLTGLTPGDFTNASVFLGDPSDPQVVIGLIESAQVVSTPEPNGLVMVIVGCTVLAVVLAWRRRVFFGAT